MGTPAKCAKCDEVIESLHRHDFRYCKCRTIFVDGGKDYFRCGGDLGSVLVQQDGQWVSLLAIHKAQNEERARANKQAEKEKTDAAVKEALRPAEEKLEEGISKVFNMALKTGEERGIRTVLEALTEVIESESDTPQRQHGYAILAKLREKLPA